MVVVGEERARGPVSRVARLCGRLQVPEARASGLWCSRSTVPAGRGTGVAAALGAESWVGGRVRVRGLVSVRREVVRTDSDRC